MTATLPDDAALRHCVTDYPGKDSEPPNRTALDVGGPSVDTFESAANEILPATTFLAWPIAKKSSVMAKMRSVYPHDEVSDSTARSMPTSALIESSRHHA